MDFIFFTSMIWDVEWLMLFNITVTHELEYSNLVTLIRRVRCIFKPMSAMWEFRSLPLAIVRW